MQELKVTRAQCSMCKDWKPIADFHKEKAKPLGIQSRCRYCKAKEPKKTRKEEPNERQTGNA